MPTKPSPEENSDLPIEDISSKVDLLNFNKEAYEKIRDDNAGTKHFRNCIFKTSHLLSLIKETNNTSLLFSLVLIGQNKVTLFACGAEGKYLDYRQTYMSTEIDVTIDFQHLQSHFDAQRLTCLCYPDTDRGLSGRLIRSSQNLEEWLNDAEGIKKLVREDMPGQALQGEGTGIVRTMRYGQHYLYKHDSLSSKYEYVAMVPIQVEVFSLRASDNISETMVCPSYLLIPATKVSGEESAYKAADNKVLLFSGLPWPPDWIET